MIIIKSLGRKTASFSQLLNYINKGRIEGDEYCFKHNVYGFKSYSIVKEFKQNLETLKKRKDGNSLYHEVISIKHQKGYSKEELREILKDLADKYVLTRANNCLVYGVIHEQHNQTHVHLMISSNEILSSRPHYFSQGEFEEIKKQIRQYAYEKYPQLERDEQKEKHIDKAKKNSRAKSKSIDREVHLKKRTGKQSDREKLKEKIKTIFHLSKSYTDLINNLRIEKLELYQRGQTYGFIDTLTARKYRLKTLELEQEFTDMIHEFKEEKQTAKTHQEQNSTKSQEQANDIDPEFEKQEVFDNDLHKQVFGKAKSGKDYIRDSVKVTLENSKTFEDFLRRLDEQHIKIYRVNNSFGFIDIQTDWKYRLETLGLEKEFESFVIKTKQPKNFREKLKDFGKRLLHEVANDAEHLITGKKPILEDEIWTQEKAGNREKDSKQDYRKVYKHASDLNKDELEKAAFKRKMNEARKTNEKLQEKGQYNNHTFTKK